VVVPELTFLMIDGRGDPNTSQEYQDAVQALFALSYGVKFAIRRSGGTDHKVAPLEGLWWAHDWRSFADGNKAAWSWTAVIRQPFEATSELVERTVAEMTAKKPLPALTAVRLESFIEGESAQVLHIGPYSAEGPTIARLHQFIAEHGCGFDGLTQKHHEIYLGDPRRAAPERLRTIIRQAMTPLPLEP
jgi:hypothetical protein